jgi:hypothetical protein
VEAVFPAQSEEDEAAAVAAYPTQSLETSEEMFAGRSSQMNTKAKKCHVSKPMLLLHPVLSLERAAKSRCLLRLHDLCPCLHRLLRAHLTLDEQSLDQS